MVIVTTQNIDNREQQTLGLVTVSSYLSNNISTDIQNSLNKLMEQAIIIGANAIVGFHVVTLGVNGFALFGTAVKILD